MGDGGNVFSLQCVVGARLTVGDLAGSCWVNRKDISRQECLATVSAKACVPLFVIEPVQLDAAFQTGGRKDLYESLTSLVGFLRVRPARHLLGVVSLSFECKVFAVVFGHRKK